MMEGVKLTSLETKIKEVLEALDGIAVLDKTPTFEGRKMSCYVRSAKKPQI